MRCQVLNNFATETVRIDTDSNSCLQLVTNRGELAVSIPGWVKLNRKLRPCESRFNRGVLCFLRFLYSEEKPKLIIMNMDFSQHSFNKNVYFFVIVYYFDHLPCNV